MPRISRSWRLRAAICSRNALPTYAAMAPSSPVLSRDFAGDVGEILAESAIAVRRLGDERTRRQADRLGRPLEHGREDIGVLDRDVEPGGEDRKVGSEHWGSPFRAQALESRATIALASRI